MWTFSRLTTSLFDLIYAPMASWPAWLSLGIISAVLGVLLLVAFRYTSNQDAIGKARDDIKANMLAMKLFKDSLLVTFGAQLKVIWQSFKILLLSIPPLLVAMIVMVPLFVQMTSRYQFVPVKPGQTATVKVYYSDDFAARELAGDAKVELKAPQGVELVSPLPWRKQDSREAHWIVRANAPGDYELTVLAGDEEMTKQFPVGDRGDFTGAVSPLRSSYDFWEKLGFPWEEHPRNGSNIRAVEVHEILAGASPDVLGVPVLGNWVVYFLLVSMLFALMFKPILKVRI